MKYSFVTLPVIAFVLLGCATTNTTTGDSSDSVISSYKRSRPVASTPASPQSFAYVEDNRIFVGFNDTLHYLQSRKQCDTKPVEKIVTPPPRVRRCVKGNILVCAEYETAPGEVRPECLVADYTGRTRCLVSENPNKPTISYKTVEDCYPTPPPPAIKGQIRLYAASSGLTREMVATQGRPIGQVTLQPNGQVQEIQISGNGPATNECLALVDAGGQVINIPRGPNNPNSYLFGTSKMRAEKIIASAKEQAERDRNNVNLLKSRIEASRQVIAKNAAWKTDRCVTPAMRPFPPEPKTMGMEESTLHGRASCGLMLGSQIGQQALQSAIMAAQEYEYKDAMVKFLHSPGKIAACARRPGTFNEAAIANLRGESAKLGLGSGDNIISSLIEMYSGAFKDAGTTTTQKNSMIVEMLRRCTAAAVSSCEEPRTDWVKEVEKIRNEPQNAMKACQSEVETVSRNSIELREAELAAQKSAAIAQSINPAVSTAKLSIESSSCQP